MTRQQYFNIQEVNFSSTSKQEKLTNTTPPPSSSTKLQRNNFLLFPCYFKKVSYKPADSLSTKKGHFFSQQNDDRGPDLFTLHIVSYLKSNNEPGNQLGLFTLFCYPDFQFQSQNFCVKLCNITLCRINGLMWEEDRKQRYQVSTKHSITFYLSHVCIVFHHDILLISCKYSLLSFLVYLFTSFCTILYSDIF